MYDALRGGGGGESIKGVEELRNIQSIRSTSILRQTLTFNSFYRTVLMYETLKPQRLQQRIGRGYTFPQFFPQYSGYMGFLCLAGFLSIKTQKQLKI